MEPYRSYFPTARHLLPQTERLTRRVLSLPTGTAIGLEAIETICEVVRLACSQTPDIVDRLARAATPGSVPETTMPWEPM